ncbi:MAG: copper chaperone PCu(A)C [Wenzhouxiangella sp.]
MKMIARGLLATVFALSTAPIVAESALEFSNAWSPEAPPGRMMAGFVEIHNPSDRAVVLVDGKSPQFGRVEIHTMKMDDGVMRMRRLDELAVEPGESVQLESGGLHLMLIEPAAPLSSGDRIEVTLIDADGGEHPFVLEVRPRSH